MDAYLEPPHDSSEEKEGKDDHRLNFELTRRWFDRDRDKGKDKAHSIFSAQRLKCEDALRKERLRGRCQGSAVDFLRWVSE